VSVMDMVREFHETFGLPISDEPRLPLWEHAEFRRRLLDEEFFEYEAASYGFSLEKIANALADMVYDIYGTALVYGIPLDDVIAEVHRSNMTKLGADGKPIYDERGKVLEGPNYEPPRIAEVLARAERSNG